MASTQIHSQIAPPQTLPPSKVQVVHLSKVFQIVADVQAAGPILQAATLLRQYLMQLFDQDAVTVARSSRPLGGNITLRVATDRDEDDLSTQGYILRSVADQKKGFEIVGGSPIAVLWGVAELAEFWGVRFLTYRDILPDHPGSIRYPLQTIKREPTIAMRGVRLYNDWPNDPCKWPAREYDVMLDQLAKMRINQVMMSTRPSDPFWHMQWRGAKKDHAATNYGFRLPIERDMIGYELFQESGDATRGKFSNPDLDDHDSYDDTVLAGKRYLKHIVDASHQRGMKLAVSVVITDFPEPIKRRLAEVTQRQHKISSQAGVLTRIRYGQWTEGATHEVASAMSIRNPQYLDLVRHALRIYIDAVENCDQLYLWTSEFRNSDADVQYAWDDLDHRYQLSAVLPYDKLIEQARSRAEINPDRAEHEVKADICLLWLFDDLLNRHPIKRGPNSPQIVASGLNAELNRYVPHVLADCDDYMVNLGYMPTSITRWADTLKVARDKPMRFSMTLTTEDDNVGPFPQYSAPSVHRTVKAISKHQVWGYFTRQWNYTKTLPALHYLTHASWQTDLDVEQSHRHLFEPICGRSALEPLLEGMRQLEKLTTQMHRRLDCPTFLSPHIISGRWSGGDAAYFGQKDSINRLKQIHRSILTASEQIQSAENQSKPAGKALLSSMYHHAMFGVKWMEALIAMAHASRHHQESKNADHNGDTDTFDNSQIHTAQELANARDLFVKATEHWVQCVEDRCDLGVLAALNEYAIKPIRAIHHLAHLDSIHWSRNH